MERTLHVAIAAVAVMGWALAYQTLNRREDARATMQAPTKLSANIEAAPALRR